MKNPKLAVILCFFIIGLGQIYNGQIGKGIGVFLTAGLLSGISGIMVMASHTAEGKLMGLGMYIFLFVPVWLYAMYDAYTNAVKINKKLS